MASLCSKGTRRGLGQTHAIDAARELLACAEAWRVADGTIDGAPTERGAKRDVESAEVSMASRPRRAREIEVLSTPVACNFGGVWLGRASLKRSRVPTASI